MVGWNIYIYILGWTNISFEALSKALASDRESNIRKLSSNFGFTGIYDFNSAILLW